MGINVDNVYQSKSNFLKAADLPTGKKIKVTIESSELVQMDDNGVMKDKVSVHFVGKEKTLMLNKTNSGTISHVYGPDTDGWNGKEIFLFSTQVDFGGQMVPAIRVDIPMVEATAEDNSNF
jgi:hypothetical protein